jgi:hypothetical protein
LTDAANLIAGDDLKATAYRFIDDMRARIKTDQNGLLSVFDGCREPPQAIRSGSLMGG